MEMPLVSVIVPVYKVEPYLHRCVDSILAQTYHNLEIILVDDGSPDNCGKICDEYARKDKRIKVIHKKNGGQSEARNVGLDVAKGEYVTFIDSDDWIHNQYIEILYNDIIQANADVSMCTFVRISAMNNNDKKISTHKVEVLNKEQAIERTLYQKKLDSSPWDKLYKRNLFDSLRFTVGRIYEDLEIIYQIYDRAVILTYTDEALYYYFYREDSTLGVFNQKRLVVLDITDEIVKYMEEKYPAIVPAAKDRKLSANFNMLALMSLYKSDDESSIRRCWDNICKLRWNSLFNPKVRLKNKLGILVSLFGEKALMICFKLFLKR